MEGGVSASSAWQLLWWVGAIFCVLAGAWFLALAVPDERSPLAWVLALAFGLVCIAAAASLRRLLREAFVSPGPVSYSSALLVTSLWAFAETLGRFLDEAAFRILLCWRVLTGQLPQKIEHRSWKPERESPVIINVYDWASLHVDFQHLGLAACRRRSGDPRESGVLQATAGRRRDGGHYPRSWSDEVEFALRERRTPGMGSAKSSVGVPGEPRRSLRPPGSGQMRERGADRYGSM
jgi:hypothetical protein